MKNAKMRNFKILNFKFLILNSRRAGFTLIEVIVAIAILAITLVIVMQLFSGGLRASRTSCDYTRAIVHAKDKMEEFLVEPIHGVGGDVTSGSFDDGFNWESTIEPYKKLEDSKFNLLKIKIKVSWQGGPQQQKSVELISMRVVSEKEE